MRKKIMDDLKKVAESQDGVLEGKEYINTGKYSMGDVVKIFGSWKKAKREAGIEVYEDEQDYDSVQQERSKNKNKDLHPYKITYKEAIQKLKENGPATRNEYGYDLSDHAVKKRGVAKFNVDKSFTSIYYLFDYHDTKEIVKKYIQVNKKAFSERKPKSIKKLISRNFTQKEDKKIVSEQLEKHLD